MTLLEKLHEMQQLIWEVRQALSSDDPTVWAEGAGAADELGIYDEYTAAIAEKSAEQKEARQMAAAEARYERNLERGLYERNS